MQPIIVSQRFTHTTASVWTAITDQKEMIQWFFDNIPEFKAIEGFTTEFNVDSTTRSFYHIWEVITVIPEKQLKIQWTYKEFKGVAFVEFVLTKSGNDTLLTVTCTGIETFNQNIPEFQPESCLAGWQYFIQGNLKEYLAQ